MLLKIWVTLFIALIVFGTVFYFYSDITVGASYLQFHIKAKNFLDFLLPVVLLGFGVSLVLGVIGALFFPHSIAGPIYRIERELLQIGEGDLSKKLNLRERDSCKDLADNINKMVGELRNKIKQIDDCSDKIAHLVDTPDTADSSKTIEDIKNTTEALKKAVGEFKL
ncbi:MAG: methyl-accepting chemotaxis protein [Pseudomonadota bacterium]